MRSPDLAVVIPVHRRATLVGEAVASVLAQELPPATVLEIVVVDDGSDDATPGAVEALAAAHPEVRPVLLPHNRGPAGARNAGIAHVRAPLLTFLDSDDRMLPGRLAFQLERLEAPPPCDAVTGTESLAVQPGVEPPAWVTRLEAGDGPPRHIMITMLLATDLVRAVGGFDESMRNGEDTDLAVRLRDRGVRFAHEPRPILERRIFGDNLIYDDGASRAALLRAVRGHLDRQRPQPGTGG